MSDEQATVRLASFVEELTYSHLPEQVILKTKACILDSLAATLAGLSLDSTKTIANFVRALAPEGEASLIGFDTKAPPHLAALVNGVSAHGAEFDDWHSRGAVHPGCIVLPAALAEGEKMNKSGRDFLVSVLAGYEAMIRVGLGCLGTGFSRGFHPTGTCGPFGAAAAVCKILETDAEQIANAFGLVGSQAGGLMQFMISGSWVKRLHAGWSALTGVLSSRLAHQGYKGPTDVLEGEYGFCRAYSKRYDPTLIIKDLGRVYETLTVQPKVYPCCSELFSSIDAALEIVKENKLEPLDIERIRVRSIWTRLLNLDARSPS